MLNSGFAEGQGGGGGRRGGGGGSGGISAAAAAAGGGGGVEEGTGKRREGEGRKIDSTKGEEEEEEEEGRECTVLPSIHLSVTSEALRRVIEYVYCDECLSPLAVPIVFEVLDAAALYMLPGLRNQCINTLMEKAEEIDVFFLLETARMYDLPRLQNFVMERMADILEEVIETEEFSEMVKESAATVEKREEIDSIPVIDEIRFLIHRMHRFERRGELERKLGMIDRLLERLNLCA